ncbi:MAG: sterol desaturase family protein [Lewinellaceae bacterium]|nr:sterol desaturase family protein [Lewinellaceae bacterium]
MAFLIERLGLFPAYFTAAAFVFLRYLLLAGFFFFIFYNWKKQVFAKVKIQNRSPRRERVMEEVRDSFLTAFVFASVGLGIYYLRQAGLTRIYLEPGAYGWWYLPVSFFLLTFLHDTYFYWMHRLMHNPRLFRLLHREHHRSDNPTPWTSLAFHPLESLVEIGIVPLAVVVLPFHPLVLLAFFFWAMFWNVIGHLGYEIFPGWFVRHPVFRWLNTATHHNMHHSRSGCNYGLYYNFWDTWMGTNHADYLSTFDEIKSR